MPDYIHHPAVQAGLLPFLLGLGAAWLLARTRLLVFAPLAGFVGVVVLAFGLSFEPLTALRKLVLVVLGVSAASWVLEARARELRWPLGVLLAAGVLWMLSRLIEQWGLGAAVLPLAGSVLYVLALADGMRRVSRPPLLGAAVGVPLGLGSGVLAVLGSSVILGMGAVAVGVASGGMLVALLLRPYPASPARTVGVVPAVVCGLSLVLVAWQGTLPWFALLPVLAAPWLGLMAAAQRAGAAQATAALTAGFIPMLLGIVLALWVGRQFP